MMGWLGSGPQRHRGWLYLLALLLILSLGLTAGIWRLTADLGEVSRPRDDVQWTIYQLGYEHQRLLLAIESEASPADIALRGDIFLSRVFELRDSPSLEKVRERLDGSTLILLLESAKATEALLANVPDPGGREALRSQLRADASKIRQLMIGILNAQAALHADGADKLAQTVRVASWAVWTLLLGLVVLGGLLLQARIRLRAAGRREAAALAFQDNVLDVLDDGVLGISRQGQVVFANRRARQLLGPAAQPGSTMAAQPEQGLPAALRSCLAMPWPSDPVVPLPALRADIAGPQGVRHYLVQRSAVPEADGGGAASLVVIADITAEEEAAQRSADYAERLDDVGRLVAYAAVSGGLVHELSQPLAAIRNYAHALGVSLRLRGASEEQLAIVAHLCEEVDRAADVLSNVRRLGPQDIDETGVCDLREALDKSIRLVSMGSNPPPVRISATHGGVRVRGSLPLIGQVLVNLVKNALSASAAAGRAGAEVSIITRGGVADIEVADFGAGVAADMAQTLFMPFSKSSHRGMGLGLAICQRIASTLGGSLSWRNQEAGGAVFTFTVPLASEEVFS